MKKPILFIFLAVVIVMLSIQLFYTCSSNSRPDMTVEEFALDYYDDYNVYREGEDSLILTLQKESAVVRCVQGPFRTTCTELNAGTLLIESDVNHDSLVSYQELRHSIQKADIDKDGFINKQERDSIRARYNIQYSANKVYGTENFNVNRLPYQLDYNPVKKIKQK